MESKIISQFLTRKVLLNFIGVFLILSLIIIGNQFFIVVKESNKIGLFNNEIFYYTFLKFGRDLPELIIISFLISVFITLRKIRKTSEKVILITAGLSDLKIAFLTKKIISLFVILLFILSSIVTPLAYKELYSLKENAQNRSNISFKESNFQHIGNSNFYSEEVFINGEIQDLKNVYIFRDDKQKSKEIIYAMTGQKFSDRESGNIQLDLTDGYIVTRNFDGLVSNISKFENYKLIQLANSSEPTLNPSQQVEAMSFIALIKSNLASAKNEIFYRVSQPIMLLLLVIATFILIESNPRSSTNRSILYVSSLFLVYFNFIIYSKEFVMPDWLSFAYYLFGIHFVFIILLHTVNRFNKNFS